MQVEQDQPSRRPIELVQDGRHAAGDAQLAGQDALARQRHPQHRAEQQVIVNYHDR
jgi:hypothetical protein